MIVNEPRRIYLDNAATSWPKPEAVYQAVEHYQRQLGAPVGRGAYREASEVERLVLLARRRIAELVGLANPQRVVFSLNGTDALNTVLHGVLRPGDHVVTSALEHNSVLRPLRFLEKNAGVEVTRVTCDAAGFISPDDIQAALRRNTKLIALTHASNVTGAIQPVEAVGRVAREHGVLFLVDAAQTLGQLPFNMRTIGCHFAAAPGHKSLLGPLGTGVFCLADDCDVLVHSLRQGGTGTNSEQDEHPDSLPEKYEAGNHNAPGILGLSAGIAEIQQRSVAAIRAHHLELTARLLVGLREIRGVKLIGPNDASRQVGVISIQIAGYDPQEIAMSLDAAYRIQIRAGLHCAGLAHRTLGTEANGGTVRFSVGIYSTAEEIDMAVQAIQELSAAVA